MILIKLGSRSHETQTRRFWERIGNPARCWRFNPVEVEAHLIRDNFSRARVGL